MSSNVEVSRAGSGRLIAMLVDHVSDLFFASLARRIDRRARSLGYKLVFGSTENDSSFMPKLLSVFNNMNVAAYIIAPPEGAMPDLKEFMHGGRPVVLFDRWSPDAAAYSVVTDNFRGAYDAVGHLIEAGRHHIALVTSGCSQKRIVDRRKGYEAAVGHHSLPPIIIELPASATAEQAMPAIRAVLKEHRRLDAVLFADSSLGFAIPGVLRQLKKQVPDDISVIGFDDNENFQLFVPAITAVVQPVDEIVEAIFQCISGHAGEKRADQPCASIILPTRMVIRSSTLKTKAASSLAAGSNR